MKKYKKDIMALLILIIILTLCVISLPFTFVETIIGYIIVFIIIALSVYVITLFVLEHFKHKKL